MIIKKDVDLTLMWTSLLFRLVKTLTSCFPKKEKPSFISKTFTGTRAAKNHLGHCGPTSPLIWTKGCWEVVGDKGVLYGPTTEILLREFKPIKEHFIGASLHIG